jgi:hypothetical protein
MIPDPIYEKVIQAICDFFTVSFFIGVTLLYFNIISADVWARISAWIVLLFLLVCIYDKWEQWRYFRSDKK